MDGTASFEMSLSHDDVPVKWMFKGVELKPSDRCKILRERKAHKLILQNVDSSNAGEYTAVVGHLQCSATLTVEGKHRHHRPDVSMFLPLCDGRKTPQDADLLSFTLLQLCRSSNP